MLYLHWGIIGVAGVAVFGALVFFAGFFLEAGRIVARQERRRYLRWRAYRDDVADLHQDIEEFLRGFGARAD